MAAHNYADLAYHVGHEIVCVAYADGVNVALECEECGVVLLDFDQPPAAMAPGHPEAEDGLRASPADPARAPREPERSEMRKHFAVAAQITLEADGEQEALRLAVEIAEAATETAAALGAAANVACADCAAQLIHG